MANIIKNVSSPCPAAGPAGGNVTRSPHQDLPLWKDAKQYLSACPALLSSPGVPCTPGCPLPLWPGAGVGGGLQPHCCWVEVL